MGLGCTREAGKPDKARSGAGSCLQLTRSAAFRVAAPAGRREGSSPPKGSAPRAPVPEGLAMSGSSGSRSARPSSNLPGRSPPLTGFVRPIGPVARGEVLLGIGATGLSLLHTCHPGGMEVAPTRLAIVAVISASPKRSGWEVNASDRHRRRHPLPAVILLCVDNLVAVALWATGDARAPVPVHLSACARGAWTPTRTGPCQGRRNSRALRMRGPGGRMSAGPHPIGARPGGPAEHARGHDKRRPLGKASEPRAKRLKPVGDHRPRSTLSKPRQNCRVGMCEF